MFDLFFRIQLQMRARDFQLLSTWSQFYARRPISQQEQRLKSIQTPSAMELSHWNTSITQKFSTHISKLKHKSLTTSEQSMNNSWGNIPSNKSKFTYFSLKLAMRETFPRIIVITEYSLRISVVDLHNSLTLCLREFIPSNLYSLNVREYSVQQQETDYSLTYSLSTEGIVFWV